MTKRTGSGSHSGNENNFLTLICLLGAGLCILTILIVWVTLGPEKSPSSKPAPAGRAGGDTVNPQEEDTGTLYHRMTGKPASKAERSSSGGGSPSSSGGSSRGPGQSGGGSSNVIKTFSGEGYKKLPSFQVHGSWTMKWKSDSVFFAAYLHDEKTGRLVDTLGDDRSRGTSNKRLKSGKYYLEISSAGKWKIKIIQSG